MNGIAAELAKLHVLEGAEFIIQLKAITARNEFRSLKDDPYIFTTGGESSADFDNLLVAARKAVELGYKVYILPNPKACEVLIFKGKKVLTVKRRFALQKSFIIDFRKRYG